MDQNYLDTILESFKKQSLNLPHADNLHAGNYLHCISNYWHRVNTILGKMIQWLRLHAAKAGGLGLIPDQGSRSHILQLKKKKKILHATTKTQFSQIN